MTYTDAIIFRNHLGSFLAICDALPDEPNQAAFDDAVELWRKVYPNSPILTILVEKSA